MKVCRPWGIVSVVTGAGTQENSPEPNHWSKTSHEFGNPGRLIELEANHQNRHAGCNDGHPQTEEGAVPRPDTVRGASVLESPRTSKPSMVPVGRLAEFVFIGTLQSFGLF